MPPTLLLLLALQAAPELPPFRPLDVFELEWADDPRVAPDGASVVYVRSGFDVMTDRTVRALWTVDLATGDHRPLVQDASSPRWSPSGDRLAYVAETPAGGAEIFVRWIDTGATAAVTRVPQSPGALAWSPDGKRIAFTMRVPKKPEPLAEMPEAPKGATWAEPPRVVERVEWRADGEGLLEDAYSHVFVVPADGGTPRQVTQGDFDHAGPPAWLDARRLVVSANREEDAELHPLGTELFLFDADEPGEPVALTDRDGPDHSPAVSPDGAWIAWAGFDDRGLGHGGSQLYARRSDGGPILALTEELDRDVDRLRWHPDGSGLFVSYADRGVGIVAFVDLEGGLREVARDLGGTTLGRPYGSGAFDVGPDGSVVFTRTGPARPADLARVAAGEAGRGEAWTALNEDLLAHRAIGPFEEVVVPSSAGGLPIQAWIQHPPDFDPARRYPLLLEIHGGPFADYGPRFAAEIQLYAAAGYVVVYANPRGSTSYGLEFANRIHHAYPGEDYDDLMSVVDALCERPYVDRERLCVTGGSGGGVLTAWIVGKSDRFRAAVVAKPVINWTSHVLTADAPAYFTRYWFPAMPWEAQEEYWRRSPLSLAGSVTTPTMLLTGVDDLRTPIGESEQLYHALKLRGVPTALVRVPGASHDIAARPSRLVGKVAHVLAWFERHAK